MNDPTSSRSFFLGFPQTSLRPLGDAVTNKNQKEKMNVIGIIVELGIPRMSKGSDYVLIMRIVDQWHHKDEVLVSIFTKKLEDLPQAKHCGDIILLYNIVMRPHEGTPSLVFQKQYSSFALFEGKSSTDLNPYHTSSTFCLKNQDELYVRRARAWSLHFEPDGGGTEYLIYLKDIKDGEFCDLVCKILLVSEVSQDEWVLFVWDGTDAPTLTFDSEQDSEAASLLPSHQDPLSLPREAVCTFPSVGTILRVGGFSDNPGFGQYFQGWNQWVRFRNIKICASSRVWRGILLPTSKIRSLSNNDKFVVQRERDYNDRLSTYDSVSCSNYQYPCMIALTFSSCVFQFSYEMI